MLTKICTLKFADGHVITAQVTAASPQSRPPVTYTGDTSRLSRLKTKSDAATLDAYFATQAEDLGAEFSSSSTGDYDIWAE